MNWDRIAGNLRQAKGLSMQVFGRMINDRLYVVAGRCEELAGKIQTARGMCRDATKKRQAMALARRSD